jgi:hypothetical protein
MTIVGVGDIGCEGDNNLSVFKVLFIRNTFTQSLHFSLSVARACSQGLGMRIWGVCRNMPDETKKSPHVEKYWCVLEL